MQNCKKILIYNCLTEIFIKGFKPESYTWGGKGRGKGEFFEKGYNSRKEVFWRKEKDEDSS